MTEMGRLDHLEERLRVIEGGGDYAFANLEELFLVPNIITPPKFKVPDYDKYKWTTCPKNHLRMNVENRFLIYWKTLFQPPK